MVFIMLPHNSKQVIMTDEYTDKEVALNRHIADLRQDMKLCNLQYPAKVYDRDMTLLFTLEKESNSPLSK